MSTYRDVLNDLKQKNKDQLRAIVEEYADKAAHALGKYIDGNVRLASYSVFCAVIKTVIADGNFDKDEYYVSKPVLDMLLGGGISYEDTVEGVKIALRSLNTADLDTAFDTIAREGDADLKHALFVLCAALSVADKDVSSAELAWIGKFAD